MADLARRTRFTKPSTAFAVDALVLAGLLEAWTVGNERRLLLATSGEILPGLRPPIVQPDWVARFGVALEVLRFEQQDGMSPSVRAIEARRLVEGLLARIASEGLPQPDLDAFGDRFQVRSTDGSSSSWGASGVRVEPSRRSTGMAEFRRRTPARRPRLVGLRLTHAAYRHGLARAPPDAGMARLT